MPPEAFTALDLADLLTDLAARVYDLDEEEQLPGA
jgi:hypothetical protein